MKKIKSIIASLILCVAVMSTFSANALTIVTLVNVTEKAVTPHMSCVPANSGPKTSVPLGEIPPNGKITFPLIGVDETKCHVVQNIDGKSNSYMMFFSPSSDSSDSRFVYIQIDKANTVTLMPHGQYSSYSP